MQVKLAGKRFLAGSLGLAAGVMLYVSLVEIFVKSQDSFANHGFSEVGRARRSYFLCFVVMSKLVCQLAQERPLVLAAGFCYHGPVRADTVLVHRRISGPTRASFLLTSTVSTWFVWRSVRWFPYALCLFVIFSPT